MRFRFTSRPIDCVPAELVLLMQYERQVPLKGVVELMDWRINGKISRLVRDGVFTGKAREMLLMPAETRFKAEKLVLLGLGMRDNFEPGHLLQVFDFVFETVARLKASEVCLSLSSLLPAQYDWREAVKACMSKVPESGAPGETIFCEPAPFVQEARRRLDEFEAKTGELCFD